MKIIKFLDKRIEEILIGVLLSGMSIIIAIQVFMRYVMKASLSWSEEIARYMFIWMVYIGISYGVKQSKHIKIDAAVNIFPRIIRKYLYILSDFIFLFFSVVIVIKSKEVSSLIFKLGQVSPATGIAMGYVYLAVPIGLSLVCIRLVQRIFFKIKNLKETTNY